jgi:hypothetical protein
MTPQEQERLKQLEAKFATRSPGMRATADTELFQNNFVMSPEEDARLAELEAKFGSREAQPAPQEEGILSQVGSVIDQYSGAASARKALDTVLAGGGIRQAASDFVDQYSQNPDMAPTGKEIAANRLGLTPESQTIPRNPMAVADEARAFNRPIQDVPKDSEVASPAGLAGFGIDVASDPLNLVGLLPFTKIARGGKAFLKGSARADEAAKAATATNTAFNAGDVAKQTIKESKTGLVKLFRPEVSPDFKDYQRIATENGIDPKLLNESHEFGENSLIARHGRSVAEGPLGADRIERYEKFIKDTSKAVDGKLQKLGQTDRILDNADAGQLILDKWDEGVDRFFGNMAETYGNALKLAPDMRLDKKSSLILNNKLNEMERWAISRLGRNKTAEKALDAATKQKDIARAGKQVLEAESSVLKGVTPEARAQAQEVLEAVKIAKNAMNSSGGDLNQVYAAMRDIGDVAFKKKKSLSAIPSDQKKFQEMYFSLQKGMTESIRSGLGDEFADQLIKNNSEMSDFFSKRSKLDKILGNDGLDTEKVFDKLIMKGGTGELEALFSVLDTPAKNQLRATFLKNIIPRTDDVIHFKSARSKLGELRQKGVLRELFSPDELRELDDVLRLGEGAGKMVSSSSGTGASNAFRDIYGTVKNKVEGDFLVEYLKNGARKRSNFVEIAPGVEAPAKSGFARLKGSSPITKKQAAQGARVESIRERNKRLEEYKQLKGVLR